MSIKSGATGSAISNLGGSSTRYYKALGWSAVSLNFYETGVNAIAIPSPLSWNAYDRTFYYKGTGSGISSSSLSRFVSSSSSPNNSHSAYGFSMANLGDINRDGREDLLQGIPYSYSSGNYTTSGTGQYERLSSQSLTTYAYQIDIRSGSTRLRNKQITTGSPWFGFDVAAVQDVTGDGIKDSLASAPYWDETSLSTTNSGKVYLYDTTDFNSLVCVALGTQSHAYFGISVLSLGDVDGDNKGDFAVGEPYYDIIGSTTNSGRVHILSGDDCSTIYTINGANSGGMFGASLGRVGDILKNGRIAIAVGEPGNIINHNNSGFGSYEGKVYIYTFPTP